MYKTKGAYDDNHGPVVLAYDLFSDGFVVNGVDYNDEKKWFVLSMKQPPDEYILTVEDLTQEDVDNILALEEKMLKRK